MDTPIREKEAPEGATSTQVTVTSPQVLASGHHGSDRVRRRIVLGLIIVIGLGLGVYFLAINPRLQNSHELAAIAAAAGQKTVTVVKPTQTEATAPLILPGNIQANRSASIYARVDGYLKKWYVDIRDHVHEGQVLADLESL